MDKFSNYITMPQPFHDHKIKTSLNAYALLIDGTRGNNVFKYK
jgi:hypothetical protein